MILSQFIARNVTHFFIPNYIAVSLLKNSYNVCQLHYYHYGPLSSQPRGLMFKSDLIIEREGGFLIMLIFGTLV